MYFQKNRNPLTSININFIFKVLKKIYILIDTTIRKKKTCKSYVQSISVLLLLKQQES